MKFLCQSCKAKYQIADEKVVGRTMKMKCRKCGHDIIIRGDAAGPGAGRASAPPAPARRSSAPPAPARRGSAPPPAPPKAGPPRPKKAAPPPAAAPLRPPPPPPSRALGADFRSQLGATAPVQSGPSPLEHWHVSIHEVPVGPLTRADLGAKVTDGVVDGSSLVWREGFDDWRPFEQVPELRGLLPAPGGALGSLAASSHSLGASLMPLPGERPEPVVPIGGRHGAFAPPEVPAAPRPSSGMLRELSPVPAPAPTAAASSPRLSLASPEPERVARQAPAIPVGGWIAIAGAAAFGVALAVLVAGKLFGERHDAVASAAEPRATEAEALEAAAEPELVLLEEDLHDDEEQADEETGGADRAQTGVRTAARAPQGATRSAATGGKALSEEQRKMLERFAGEGAAPSNIRSGSTAGGGTGTGQGLDARQLTAVVSKNRPELQRCYELAVRGMADAPTVRMDVDLTVGMSGTVTRVRARGSAVGTLQECMERSVRRWRFPTSGNETQTTFPVVFSAGG
jgi:predicted Zn finger-like uncharacterized protein